NLEVAQQGDLYLAADSSYTDIAQEKGLVAETITLAELRPVLAVAQGNPKEISGLADLLSGTLRISLANPDAASVGKVTESMLAAAGVWEKIKANTTASGVFKPTVNDVANDVKIGAVDVGIVWDAVAAQYPGLDTVDL